MGIEIPITGLPQQIMEIPDGSIILIQGTMDSVPSFMAQLIGQQEWKMGRTVTLITSRTSQDVIDQARRIDEVNIPFFIVERTKPDEWVNYVTPDSMLIIDSFLFLSLETDKWVYKNILENLRNKCVEHRAIIILVGREGMLDPVKDYILSHLSDGIINFRTKEMDDGVARYMRVPKWVDGEPVDMFMFYTYQNDRISIDSRSRVV